MINLYDLLDACNGQLFGEPAAHLFSTFCLDPALATEPALFVARTVDGHDSHSHMRQAIAAGAVGLLCARPPDFDTQGTTVVIVRDTDVALLAYTRMMLQRNGVRVVAVSGTHSVTPTLAALQHVLGPTHQVHATALGVPDGLLALPLSVVGLQPRHDLALVRLVSRQPGEIARLAEALQPTVWLVSGMSANNAPDDHEPLVQTLGEALAALPPEGSAVISHDDDAGRVLATQAKRCLSVSVEHYGADWVAHHLVWGRARTGFDLRIGVRRWVGQWTPVLGAGGLRAALLAAAAAYRLGVPLDAALNALKTMPTPVGYMHAARTSAGALVVDATAEHDPAQLREALAWLGAATHKSDGQQDGRGVFVLGELDKATSQTDAHILYRSVGAASAEHSWGVVALGLDAARATRAAQDAGLPPTQVWRTTSAPEAARVLRDAVEVGPQDVVLVAGGQSAEGSALVQLLTRGTAPLSDGVHRLGWVGARSLRPTWVEVDRKALAANARAARALLADQADLMACVKADGYGHGALTVAQVALANGATQLGVANLDEALALREGGIDAPILVMSFAPVNGVRLAVRHNITLSVYDADQARAFDTAARAAGGRLVVHVKVDSGMGRLGVLAREAMTLFRMLGSLRALDVQGVYTHYSMADSNVSFTAEQTTTFRSMVLRPLEAAKVRPRWAHAANSAAVLLGAEYHFDMARVGILLYGCAPSQVVPMPGTVRPALTWKTVVAQVKTLPPGHAVGYGNSYITQGEERIAVLPTGYADGLRRAPTPMAEVLIGGQRAPIVGRVSMEKTTVSVTHLPNVAAGDEVVLLGQQGGEVITASDVALQIGTSSYEVLTSALARVPRL